MNNASRSLPSALTCSIAPGWSPGVRAEETTPKAHRFLPPHPTADAEFIASRCDRVRVGRTLPDSAHPPHVFKPSTSLAPAHWME